MKTMDKQEVDKYYKNTTTNKIIMVGVGQVISYPDNIEFIESTKELYDAQELADKQARDSRVNKREVL